MNIQFQRIFNPLLFKNFYKIIQSINIFIIGFLMPVLFSSFIFAQTTDKPYLAVVEKVAGKVGFFAEDGKELKQVKVGDFPHEAILSDDGKYLYVSDNGVLWMSDTAAGLNTISILDVRAMKKIGEINLGKFHRPHGLALVPKTNYLLATTENPYGLVMVDLAKRKVVRSYDVKGKAPHMVTATLDGKVAFVSNTDSKSVAAIELKTGNVKLITTGERPQGSVLSLDGKLLYVVNTAGNQISIIDVNRKEVVGNIPTGKGPGRIKITPDGKILVYNLQYLPGVGFADIKSSEQIDTVKLSGRPLSLTMSADGKLVFAGIQDQDKVFIVSVPDRKIEQIINLPKESGPDPAVPLQSK